MSDRIAPAPGPNETLTAIPGIRVGHAVMVGRPTGCTVVRLPAGTVGAVDVRGGAPGSRETDLLDPVKTVGEVHAVVLAGGSAFGLAAADGTMAYLGERGVGFETGIRPVPIVPAAVLFDLNVGEPATICPDAGCGRQATERAASAPVVQGNVGAGAGASVGKLAGADRAMRGGLGSACARTPTGATVAALVVVNALGDVIDPLTGRVIAGVRAPDGRSLADARALLAAGARFAPSPGRNTTLGVIATDARLSKAEATTVARMAHAGLARAIDPVHTPWDGDSLFAVATGSHDGSIDPSTLLQIGALAARVTADAVLRGVRAATALPGLPAAGDLETGEALP